MQKYAFLFLYFSSLLFACGNGATQNKTSDKRITKAIQKEGLPPIYEKFEDIEWLFQQETDTVYVINFWATWCAPCVKELPYFEMLHKKQKQVKIVLVSLDFSKQLESKLKPFLNERQLASEVLVLIDPDANSWVDKVDPEWSGAIPATYIYKGNKKAFYEKSFEDLEELEAVIEPFL